MAVGQVGFKNDKKVGGHSQLCVQHGLQAHLS